MPRETLPTGSSLLALARGTPAPAAPPIAPTGAPVSRERTAPKRLSPAQPQRSEIVDRLPLTITPAIPRKQKVNARISGALLEEIRDCVVSLSGPPHGLTMDEFAEEAYRRELDRLKRSHNSGQPFARRPYNPRPGRRVT